MVQLAGCERQMLAGKRISAMAIKNLLPKMQSRCFLMCISISLVEFYINKFKEFLFLRIFADHHPYHYLFPLVFHGVKINRHSSVHIGTKRPITEYPVAAGFWRMYTKTFRKITISGIKTEISSFQQVKFTGIYLILNSYCVDG